MSNIQVTIEEDYGDCGNQEGGCSGWTSIKITATDGSKTISVKDSSCYGVSQEKLIAELLEKWSI